VGRQTTAAYRTRAEDVVEVADGTMTSSDGRCSAVTRRRSEQTQGDRRAGSVALGGGGGGSG